MVTVRARRADDVPALVEVLAEQQPASQYPHRWPLPFPTEDFVVRAAELAAFVAEVDGRVAGHACVQWVAAEPGDPLGPAWSTGHGRPIDELGVVSALFTATSVRGQGVGGLLLDTAVDHVRSLGRAPCLDVVQGPSPAADIYRARGWELVGEVRPDWLEPEMPPVLAMVLRRAGSVGARP